MASSVDMSQYASLTSRPHQQSHKHKHGHHHGHTHATQPPQPIGMPGPVPAQPVGKPDQPNGTTASAGSNGSEPNPGANDKPNGGLAVPISDGAPNSGAASTAPSVSIDDIDHQGYYLVTADEDIPGEPKYAVVYYSDTRAVHHQEDAKYDFVGYSLLKSPSVWEEMPNDVYFDSRNTAFLWTIATPPPLKPLETGTKCGVGVDNKRGYLIYKDDDGVLLTRTSKDDRRLVTYRKNYYIVDERNQPIDYGRGPHYLCIAAVGATQTRYGVAYFEDGKSIDGSRKPDEFTWVDGSASTSSDLSSPNEWWDGKLSSGSLRPNFDGDEDFQCCIASIAHNGAPKAWVGTAKRRNQGFLVYKDTAANALFTEAGLRCYSYYYCAAWSG